MWVIVQRDGGQFRGPPQVNALLTDENAAQARGVAIMEYHYSRPKTVRLDCQFYAGVNLGDVVSLEYQGTPGGDSTIYGKLVDVSYNGSGPELVMSLELEVPTNV